MHNKLVDGEKKIKSEIILADKSPNKYSETASALCTCPLTRS